MSCRHFYKYGKTMRKGKLLIVEDMDLKANAIKSFVEKEYPTIEIIRKESYNSSLHEIYSNYEDYDLILLDMTMSTFDVSEEDNGGVPEPLAGRQILDGMYLRDISIPVVVVTMYKSFAGVGITEFDRELKEEYSDIYQGYIFFVYNSNDWKENLKKYLVNIYG